jgi:hypothetical protein
LPKIALGPEDRRRKTDDDFGQNRIGFPRSPYFSVRNWQIQTETCIVFGHPSSVFGENANNGVFPIA